MKLMIEVDLEKLERLDNLWRVLPNLLSDVGIAAAEAGAVGGHVVVDVRSLAQPDQDRVVGTWEVS